MKSLRIAFVSSSSSIRHFRRDASFIYRCENISLALASMGHKVSLLHISALLVRSEFDVVVFLRPKFTWMFDYAVKRLRDRGVALIGDVDDLIFDPAYAAFRPSVRNQLNTEDKARDEFVAHSKALAMLDRVQFSTEQLARRYLHVRPGAECAVIPNAAHRSWHVILPDAAPIERNISYFSGTRTHDRDFSIVAPALKRILNRHKDVSIRVVGPVSSELQDVRVITIDKVPFERYWQLVGASYITIAPIEDTPFNQCKSALKAIESGMMNVPIVASPIGEYTRLNMPGVLHAGSPDEWESQLEFALKPEHHREMSHGLRQRILGFANVDRCAMDFLDFVTK